MEGDHDETSDDRQIFQKYCTLHFPRSILAKPELMHQEGRRDQEDEQKRGSQFFPNAQKYESPANKL